VGRAVPGLHRGWVPPFDKSDGLLGPSTEGPSCFLALILH